MKIRKRNTINKYLQKTPLPRETTRSSYTQSAKEDTIITNRINDVMQLPTDHFYDYSIFVYLYSATAKFPRTLYKPMN